MSLKLYELLGTGHVCDKQVKVLWCVVEQETFFITSDMIGGWRRVRNPEVLDWNTEQASHLGKMKMLHFDNYIVDESQFGMKRSKL